MSFTYSDPSVYRQDAIRFLTGDVDPEQPLLHDEEIAYLISLNVDRGDYLVAAYCAEAIAAKFARQIDFSADSQSLGASVLQDKYCKLAASLRTQDMTTFPGDIFMGGVDPGEGVFPGTLPPAFGTGMHDNPAAGNQEYGDYQDQYDASGDDWRVQWGMSDVP